MHAFLKKKKAVQLRFKFNKILSMTLLKKEMDAKEYHPKTKVIIGSHISKWLHKKIKWLSEHNNEAINIWQATVLDDESAFTATTTSCNVPIIWGPDPLRRSFPATELYLVYYNIQTKSMIYF